jgi:U3 small nucleolar RNA-associated protein 18
MYLFSSRSKEVIDTLTMNGDVSSIAFNSDGSRMYSCGDLGEIYTWDMKNRCCVDKFTDHGTVSSTRIAVSDEFLACGSNAGVVNVYKSKGLEAEARVPEKSLMNLVTPVSSLEFNNPAGEILIMASKDKPNAIKLVHLPSLTVFNNFPFVNTDYGRPNSLAFSPNSGYLALGNNKGTAMLFRLDHYDNY